MSDNQVIRTVEFISYGKQKGIDTQIDEWLEENPGMSLVDIKYQAGVYTVDDKPRLARFALVLYSGELSKRSVQPEDETDQQEQKKPSMSSMVMSMRKDLGLTKPEE